MTTIMTMRLPKHILCSQKSPTQWAVSEINKRWGKRERASQPGRPAWMGWWGGWGNKNKPRRKMAGK